MKKDLLEKEKKMSDTVKELRSQLLRKESALYLFDDYDNVTNSIQRLEDEISVLENTPFLSLGDEPANECDKFLIPEVLREISVNLFHTDLNIEMGKKQSYIKNVMDVVPKKIELSSIDESIILAESFKCFLIDLRKRYLSELKSAEEKILATIDEELNE